MQTDATVAPPRWRSAIASGSTPASYSRRAPPSLQPPPGTTSRSGSPSTPSGTMVRPWLAVTVWAGSFVTVRTVTSSRSRAAFEKTSNGPTASSSSKPSNSSTSISMAGPRGPPAKRSPLAASVYPR